MADKKRIVIVFISGILLIAAGFLLVKRAEKAYTTNMFAMDTACTVTLYGDNDFTEVKERIKALEKVISSHDENAEVYKLNESGSQKLSEDAEKLLEESLLLHNEYGAVTPCIGSITRLWNVEGENPAVPDDKDILNALLSVDDKNVVINDGLCTLENGVQLDFGATGKGFALDEIKKILDEKDTQCAVVSFGSSSLLYGHKPDNKAFTVVVSNPDDDTQGMAKFDTDEGFISTSGGYERFFSADGKTYCHIFDEKTGKSVETDLTSVTVKCDSGIKSDFLSTCIFIGGTKELEKWLSDTDIEIVAVDKNKNVYCSETLLNSIQITNDNFKPAK